MTFITTDDDGSLVAVNGKGESRRFPATSSGLYLIGSFIGPGDYLFTEELSPPEFHQIISAGQKGLYR